MKIELSIEEIDDITEAIASNYYELWTEIHQTNPENFTELDKSKCERLERFNKLNIKLGEAKDQIAIHNFNVALHQSHNPKS